MVEKLKLWRVWKKSKIRYIVLDAFLVALKQVFDHSIIVLVLNFKGCWVVQECTR